jgi:hypothetical protein
VYGWGGDVFYFAKEGGVEVSVCGIGGDAGFLGANAVVEGEGEIGFPGVSMI